MAVILETLYPGILNACDYNPISPTLGICENTNKYPLNHRSYSYLTIEKLLSELDMIG
jgi:hypothetical protein